LNFEIHYKSFSDNVLRFNPIQIAEWLADLLKQGVSQSQAGLEDKLGIDKTRIRQFLRLMRLPAEAKARLRVIPDLNEYRIRGMMAVELL
jgi:hypothetical protein